MSRVFIDTSAVLALLVPTDRVHQQAVETFHRLQDRQAVLITSSYVLVEIYALLARRLGRDAVESFRRDFAPLIETLWVDSRIHEKGLDRMMKGLRDLSLVDAVSFVCIEEGKINEVFAFDRHFQQAGFSLLR